MKIKFGARFLELYAGSNDYCKFITAQHSLFWVSFAQIYIIILFYEMAMLASYIAKYL